MAGDTIDPSTVELIKKQYALYKKYTSSTRLQLESVKEKTKEGDAKPSTKRSSAREKLLKLTEMQFSELSTDIYDEIHRRKKATRSSKFAKEQPFLPPVDELHPKRNQSRQKLASMSDVRLSDLAADVLFEWERRYGSEIAALFPEMADGLAEEDSSTAMEQYESYAAGTPVHVAQGGRKQGAHSVDGEEEESELRHHRSGERLDAEHGSGQESTRSFRYAQQQDEKSKSLLFGPSGQDGGSATNGPSIGKDSNDLEVDYASIEAMVADLNLNSSTKSDVPLSSHGVVDELLFMDITEAEAKIKMQDKALQSQSQLAEEMKNKYAALSDEYAKLQEKHTSAQNAMSQLTSKLESLADSQQQLLSEHGREKEKLRKATAELESAELALKSVQIEVQRSQATLLAVPNVHEISGSDTPVGLIKRYHFLNDYFLVSDALVVASQGNSPNEVMACMKNLISQIRTIVEVTESLEKENDKLLTLSSAAVSSDSVASAHESALLDKSKTLRTKASQSILSLVAVAKKLAIDKRDVKELKAIESLVTELNVIIIRMSHLRVQFYTNMIQTATSLNGAGGADGKSSALTASSSSPFIQGLVESARESSINPRIHSMLFERNIEFLSNLDAAGSPTKHKSVIGIKTDEMIQVIQVILRDMQSDADFLQHASQLTTDVNQVVLLCQDLLMSGRAVILQPELVAKRITGDKILKGLEGSLLRLEEFTAELGEERRAAALVRDATELADRLKVMKQKLASRVYDIAKFTKDFLSFVEPNQE